MPEMSQERAIGFTHLLPTFFAFGVIGFGQCNRYQAIVVAGHDFLPRRWIVGEEVKNESISPIFHSWGEWKPPTQQRIKQAMLCDLNLAPGGKTGGLGEIGH